LIIYIIEYKNNTFLERYKFSFGQPTFIRSFGKADE